MFSFDSSYSGSDQFHINWKEWILNQTHNATRFGSDFCTHVRPIGVIGQSNAQQSTKKLFSIVSKLSAKRFAELHSDWPTLLFGHRPV